MRQRLRSLGQGLARQGQRLHSLGQGLAGEKTKSGKNGLHTNEITCSRPIFHYFLISHYKFSLLTVVLFDPEKLVPLVWLEKASASRTYKARLQSKQRKQDGGGTPKFLCCYFSLTCNNFELKQMASTIEKDRKLCYSDSRFFTM